MELLFVASEVAPWSKTGGLGDVAAALPAALARRGHRVRVVTPRHGGIDPARAGLERLEVVLRARDERCGLWVHRGGPGRPEVFFLEHELLFGSRRGLYGEGGRDHPDNPRRFAFLSRAALDLPRALSWRPEVVHLNDWQTALAAWMLRGEHGGAGRDPADDGHGHAVGPRLVRADRAGLRRVLVEQASTLEVRQLGVNARGRGQPDGLADLTDGGGVAPLSNGLRDEVQDPALPGCQIAHVRPSSYARGR